MFRRNRRPAEKKIHVSLTDFAADLLIGFGLPKAVTEKSRNGLYLQLSLPEKDGDIAEIALWRGIGDHQTPLIDLSYRQGGNEQYLLASSIKNPIQPLKGLLGATFSVGTKHIHVTRDQALVAICTMMKYLETAR
jgi:hypothetical protein